jgi:hypothetical protein
MKKLNTFILSLSIISIANNAFSLVMPPITNTEIKEYADSLIKRDLSNSAKKYYQELLTRGEDADGLWGLTLVDIAQGNNKNALNKVINLMQKDNVKTRLLEDLKAELLINIATEESFNNNTEQAIGHLNQYFKQYNGHYKLQDRAKALQNKLNNQANMQNINIGVILPLSGKLANIGKQLQQSINFSLYSQHLNNINLFFEDNQSSQDGSIEAATKLINKNVNMIIGPILRDNTLAANTVISSTKIPLFTFSTDTSIAGGNIFTNNINIAQESNEIARFAIDNGNNRLACLTPDDRYGNMEKESFETTVNQLGGALEGCKPFDSKNIDINDAIKELLQINKNEKIRLAELKTLEQEYDNLGNALDDIKIARIAELKAEKNTYEINFDAVFIPTTDKKILTIAPQLAFYDVDFSSGVLFLGTSAWDNDDILKNRGEHLHFTRFLSLKTDSFKTFAQSYKNMFGSNPSIIDGFAYDALQIANKIDFKNNFYNQIYKQAGFSVLTGNVKFNQNNLPNRVYGISKISRRSIKSVKQVSHLRPIDLPSELNIKKSSGFGNWFGF